jgi:hypothetical protein
LTGNPLQFEVQRSVFVMKPMPDQFASQTCAKGTVLIGNGLFDGKRLTGRTSGKRRLHPGIVDVGMIAGTAIALTLPAYMPVASRRQQGAEVKSAGGAYLLEQIGASDGSFQRGQAERG